MTGVRARLARGTAWVTAARLIVNLLSAGLTLLLARLLHPGDVGVVMLATTMLAILTAITDLSLSSALVQHPDPARSHFDTAWTLGLLRGLGLAAIFALCAFPAAWIYGDPRLPGIMLALSVGIILTGLQNPRAIMMTRRLVFWQQFMLQVGGKAVSVIVTLIVLLAWRDYWALVLGTLAGQAATILLSYTVLPYCPRLTLGRWRDLASFSIWMTLSQAVNTLNWRFDQLLVGWKLGPTTLGHYAVGNALAMIPTREAMTPITATLFPAFSSLAHDRARLAAAYQAAQGFTVAITLPVGVGMAMLAEPLVRLAMGPQWLPAVIVIQALAATFAIQSMGTLAQPLAMATGDTRLLFVRDVQSLFLRVPLIAAAMLLYGLPGVIGARLITGAAMIAFNIAVVRRVIGLGVVDQIARNLRSLLAAAAMAAALWAAGALSIGAGSWTMLARDILLLAALGGTAYVAVHALLWLATGRPAGPEQEVGRVLTLLRRRLSGKRDIVAEQP